MTDLDRFLSTFFNLEVMARYLPMIVDGFVLTTYLALVIIATGLTAGLLLAVIRSQQIRLVNWTIVFLVDMFRALPPLVIIIMIYFALPNVGLGVSGFVAVWISLSLVLTAFAEEIFWAGIVSVSKGQWEAARSTGLRFEQALLYVVLPQAVRLTIPPLTNRAIAITKGTALGSVVAVPEILTQAQTGLSFSYNPSTLTLGALAYLILFVPFVVFGRWIETRFAWKR
ncbi:MAG: amino acid ABC transporter permease [Proteobacteria bacterium]|nr:amino acid ABC transporter permease [Pseudomonadota bacterium]